MTQTPLRSKQKVLRKQPKLRDLSKSSKTGKTSLCMESTHCKVKKADVDQENTHQWLCNAGVKAETEGFVMAAQDRSLFTTPKL